MAAGDFEGKRTPTRENDLFKDQSRKCSIQAQPFWGMTRISRARKTDLCFFVPPSIDRHDYAHGDLPTSATIFRRQDNIHDHAGGFRRKSQNPGGGRGDHGAAPAASCGLVHGGGPDRIPRPRPRRWPRAARDRGRRARSAERRGQAEPAARLPRAPLARRSALFAEDALQPPAPEASAGGSGDRARDEDTISRGGAARGARLLTEAVAPGARLTRELRTWRVKGCLHKRGSQVEKSGSDV